MRKTIASFAFTMASIATPGALFAQEVPASQRMEIAGRALPSCIIQSGATGSGTNATFVPVSPTRGEVRIQQLVNPETASPNATSATITLPVICNSAHRVTVRSLNGGLSRNGNRRTAVRNGGFIEFLPYRISTAWLGQTATGQSDSGSTINLRPGNGGAGGLSIALAINAQDTPMVAGQYEDSLIIEVSAAN